jgi:diaminohydroxyphosphoribosylaminopyrimidine deaminase/5-amino-6-(5-phosphoribosylamino)uracil reductase
MPGRRPRPRVTWVFGATLDGRVAAPDGSSRWISSRAARVDAHRLRAEHDAVLVGSGAARTDDPHLAVRHGVRGRPPLRVVLDARGSIVTPASRVADTAAPTLVVLGPDAPDPALPAHVGIVRLPVDDDGRIPLPGLLAELTRRGVTTLLVEGGPTIAGSFLAAGLVDEVVGYVRAAVLGAGRPLLELPGVTTIGDLRALRLIAADVVGEDVRLRMTVRRPRGTPRA